MEKSIRLYSMDELTNLVKEFDQPSYRAKQLYKWLHDKSLVHYSEMDDLPKDFRILLDSLFPLMYPHVIDREISHDGSRKYLLSYFDDALTETVGIPSSTEGKKRLTVCFSTQAGCPMGCIFCATGLSGFRRNLSPTEIIDQVAIVKRDFGERVSNIVAMGQGEPFLNYENVLTALRYINHSKSFNIASRKITVSTCGIIQGIDRFAHEPEQFTLAVSLHAALQSVRNRLMPQMKHQPLNALHKALQAYNRISNRRVTLEYLLLKDVNDSDECLHALIDFCQALLCHINLLPYNTVVSELSPSPQSIVKHWLSSLQQEGIETTFRHSRGSDIQGACGQLKNTFFAECFT